MHALAWISLIMPQFALPIGDSSTSPDELEWAPFGESEIWKTLDDPVAGHDGDSTYVHAADPNGQEFHVDLAGLVDPKTDADHFVHLYAKRLDPVEGAELIVALHQGANSIASRTFLGLSEPYLLFRIFLTTTEASAITDYAALKLVVSVDSSNVSGAIRLTQIYLEVPIAPTSSSVIARATAAAKCVRIRSTAVVFSSAVALGSGRTTRLRYHDTPAVAIAAAAAKSVAVETGAAAVTAIAGVSTPIPEVCRRDAAVGAAQFVRPSADVFVDSWINELGSASNLFQSIDEAQADDDTTFIESSIWNPFAKVYDVALPPVADPQRDANHSIVLRAKKVWSGNPSNIVQLFARLLDPVTGSVVHAAGVELTTSYTSFVIRVPPQSASTIQGYSSLRLQLFALSGVDDPNSLVKPRVTQLYLRMPEVVFKRLVQGLAIAGAQAILTRVRGVSSSVSCVATAVALATRIQTESDSSTVVARSSSTADARRLRGLTFTATAIANGTATATRIVVLVSSATTAIASATAKVARARNAESSVVAVAIGAAFATSEPPPPPTGACCLPDGTCEDGLTVEQCVAAGGTYQGNNITCVSRPVGPQLALPISSPFSIGSWETTPFQPAGNEFRNIDEPINPLPPDLGNIGDGATSFMAASPPTAGGQLINLQFEPLVEPAVITFGVKIHVVHKRIDPISGESLSVQLFQGDPGSPGGSFIAQLDFNPSAAWSDQWRELSAADAAKVTDWSDLWGRMQVFSFSETGAIWITQVYLEAPAGGPTSITCPGPGTPEEQCGIKLIPYREPVYPHKRRMAGLLKGGKIAIFVPTRSAQYSPRRAWVGALRSDGKIGEGTPGIGRALVGHAVRDVEEPSLRFAIARAACDRACITCSEESRVPPTLCYEFSSPTGGSSGEMRFEGCFDPDVGSPFPVGGDSLPVAPDGTFDPFGASPSRPFKGTLAICEHDALLPVFPVGTRFVRCRRYQWLMMLPEGVYRFHAEEWYFEEGGFAGWFGWFTFELGGEIWDPCFTWLTDPDWPFNPSPTQVRWAINSPSSPGVTERVSPCGIAVLAASANPVPLVGRPLR